MKNLSSDLKNSLRELVFSLGLHEVEAKEWDNLRACSSLSLDSEIAETVSVSSLDDAKQLLDAVYAEKTETAFWAEMETAVDEGLPAPRAFAVLLASLMTDPQDSRFAAAAETYLALARLAGGEQYGLLLHQILEHISNEVKKYLEHAAFEAEKERNSKKKTTSEEDENNRVVVCNVSGAEALHLLRRIGSVLATTPLSTLGQRHAQICMNSLGCGARHSGSPHAEKISKECLTGFKKLVRREAEALREACRDLGAGDEEIEWKKDLAVRHAVGQVFKQVVPMLLMGGGPEADRLPSGLVTVPKAQVHQKQVAVAFVCEVVTENPYLLQPLNPPQKAVEDLVASHSKPAQKKKDKKPRERRTRRKKRGDDSESEELEPASSDEEFASEEQKKKKKKKKVLC
eukprot:Platyproteum_vivax@DN2831_c0_g1_i1.p1